MIEKIFRIVNNDSITAFINRNKIRQKKLKMHVGLFSKTIQFRDHSVIIILHFLDNNDYLERSLYLKQVFSNVAAL